MFKRYVIRSMSVVAGCALTTFVVAAALVGVLGGLLPQEEVDSGEDAVEVRKAID
jgi:hypothetical protein